MATSVTSLSCRRARWPAAALSLYHTTQISVTLASTIALSCNAVYADISGRMHRDGQQHNTSHRSLPALYVSERQHDDRPPACWLSTVLLQAVT